MSEKFARDHVKKLSIPATNLTVGDLEDVADFENALVLLTNELAVAHLETARMKDLKQRDDAAVSYTALAKAQNRVAMLRATLELTRERMWALRRAANGKEPVVLSEPLSD